MSGKTWQGLEQSWAKKYGQLPTVSGVCWTEGRSEVDLVEGIAFLAFDSWQSYLIVILVIYGKTRCRGVLNKSHYIQYTVYQLLYDCGLLCLKSRPHSYI